jgi:hypothetical protein
MKHTGATMETTLRTRNYQDPQESAFRRRFPWTFIFTHTDQDASVHVVADDTSGREITLPVGVILEMAKALKALA